MSANNHHNIFDSDDKDDTENTSNYRANTHNFVDDGKDFKDSTAYRIFYICTTTVCIVSHSLSLHHQGKSSEVLAMNTVHFKIQQ